MNSNIVYGGPVCGHNGSTADYSQNCYHHELPYYSQATDLSAHQTGISGAATGGSTHYGVTPGLHMGHSGHHQFLDPSGIISETNGLSYTNLDSSNGNPVGVYPGVTSVPAPLSSSSSSSSHQKGFSHYSSDPRSAGSQNITVSSAVSQSSTGGSAITSSSSHPQSTYSSSQYHRDFSGETSGHHPETVSAALSDCAVMRSTASVTGSLQGSVGGQYPYLEPSLLTRRNGSIAGYGADVSSPFTDINCSQLNGSPYHLNHHHHLTSHLLSPHHRPGIPGNSVAAAAPVPTYKWMQVKRNAPKQGTCHQ